MRQPSSCRRARLMAALAAGLLNGSVALPRASLSFGIGLSTKTKVCFVFLLCAAMFVVPFGLLSRLSNVSPSCSIVVMLLITSSRACVVSASPTVVAVWELVVLVMISLSLVQDMHDKLFCVQYCMTWMMQVKCLLLKSVVILSPLSSVIKGRNNLPAYNMFYGMPWMRVCEMTTPSRSMISIIMEEVCSISPVCVKRTP